MYACMKENEGVNRCLFYIRFWLIKQYLINISVNFWETLSLPCEACLRKRVSLIILKYFEVC